MLLQSRDDRYGEFLPYQEQAIGFQNPALRAPLVFNASRTIHGHIGGVESGRSETTETA
jgi:hypothetical protein